MERADSQSFAVDSGEGLHAKRTALEGPHTPQAAKKIKSFHDESTEPDGGIPAATRIVPFPEKVR